MNALNADGIDFIISPVGKQNGRIWNMPLEYGTSYLVIKQIQESANDALIIIISTRY